MYDRDSAINSLKRLSNEELINLLLSEGLYCCTTDSIKEAIEFGQIYYPSLIRPLSKNTYDKLISALADKGYYFNEGKKEYSNNIAIRLYACYDNKYIITENIDKVNHYNIVTID